MNKKIVSFSLAALVVALSALQASAEDKPLTKSRLKQAGLANLKPISAKDGMKIRGEGGSALTTGMSFVSGMLIDKNTNSYVYGVDTNHAQTCYEVSCIVGLIDPIHTTESRLNLGLTIDQTFLGTIVGGAWGGASAYVR